MLLTIYTICGILVSFGMVSCTHNPRIIPLEMAKESDTHTTECGHYSYFSIDVTHACESLVIKLNRIAGEPNLYVSKEPVKFPTYRSLAWSSYEWGDDELIISSWDPNFEIGTYYIGVHSYCGTDVSTGFEGSKYTIIVRQIHHAYPNTSDLFNRTESGIIRAKGYNYHRFCLPSDCYKVEVVLDNCIDPKLCPETYAWPELIISQTVEKPMEKSMAWILAEYEHRSISLDPNHKHVKPGHFYIGIYGWCTPDNLCHNMSQCGPCSYASNVPYNLSVISTDLCKISRAGKIYLDYIVPQIIMIIVASLLGKTL